MRIVAVLSKQNVRSAMKPTELMDDPLREALSDEFDHRLLEDREEVDLLIVMGTSLRVRGLFRRLASVQKCLQTLCGP